MNTRLNHVDLWEGGNQLKFLSPDTEIKQYEQYTHMKDIVRDLKEAGQTFKFSYFNNCIVKVDTGLETVVC